MKTKLLQAYFQYPELIEIYGKHLFSSILPKQICLAKYKCYCGEEIWYKKKTKTKRKLNTKKGRPLPYPDLEEKSKVYKTFQVYYEKELSEIAKLTLISFKNKYIYYAIEDLKSNLDANRFEINNLLLLLYSAMVYLHNNHCINLFDIWIENTYVQEKTNNNRFIEPRFQQSTSYTIITLVIFYKIRLPRQKPQPLW